jgi:hypothetical protein
LGIHDHQTENAFYPILLEVLLPSILPRRRSVSNPSQRPILYYDDIGIRNVGICLEIPNVPDDYVANMSQNLHDSTKSSSRSRCRSLCEIVVLFHLEILFQELKARTSMAHELLSISHFSHPVQ